MSDPRDDAPPTREGQAVTPQSYVTFGVGPDGQFFLDCTEDEMVVRGLMALGWFEVDRYFVKKRIDAMMKQAQDNRVVQGMLGADAPRINRRLRGLR